jgi:LysM repeat protein
MTRKRLPILALLGINVAVAVVTTLLVLLVWDARREPLYLVPPTFSGVSSQSGAPPGAEAPVGGDTTGQVPAPAEAGAPPDAGEGGTDEAAAPDASEEASGDLIIHVVQAGDTLFQLALDYEVSIQDIVIANNLDNEEVILDVGQELIMPVGGLPPTPIPSPTVPVPTATLELSPIATVTPLPPGTIDILIEQVISPGDVTREAVVIVNNGAALDLEGWTLGDEEGNEYVFPTFRVFGSGSGVTVHTGVGEDTGRDLYWGRSTAVWGEPSDTVILRNPSGDVQSEFPVEQ